MDSELASTLSSPDAASAPTSNNLAEEKSEEIKSLDLQQFALRLFSFVADFVDFDSKHSKILSVNEDVYPRSWIPSYGSRHRPFLKEIHFTEITFAKVEEPLDINTFCSSDIEFKDVREREDFYWKIIWKESPSFFSILLMDLMNQISEQFGFNHFIGRVIRNGRIEEILIPFDKLDVKALMIVPKEMYLYKQVDVKNGSRIRYIENDLASDDHIQIIVVYYPELNLLFDIGALQFGMHGPRGELVGILEEFADFRKRFPGIVKDLDVKHPEAKFMDLIRNTSAYIQFTNQKEEEDFFVKSIQHLFPEASDAKWCWFCGKRLQTSSQCAKCREVSYCEKKCQVDDWKFHKLTCSRKIV